jgi:hypothetical protein
LPRAVLSKVITRLEGDDFKAQWYSSQLKALQEPSLFELTKVPDLESYRFLWLRTFNHPIATRVDIKPDGTGVLTTKVANGAGGFRPGVLIVNTTRILTKEEVQAILLRVSKFDFWQAANPVDDQTGTDGSQWVIEGVKKGQYHVVDRWMPKSGITRELGLFLMIHLAKLDVPKNEIY